MILRLISVITLTALSAKAQVYVRTVPGTAAPFGGTIPALQARPPAPMGIVTDSEGGIYFADSSLGVIFRLDKDRLSVFAGNMTDLGDVLGDEGPAVNARLRLPTGLAIDSLGNLYVADRGNKRIRKIAPSGIISTFAGGGTSTTDGIAATAFSLKSPSVVAVNSRNEVYFSDEDRFYKVANDGSIKRVAGGGKNNDAAGIATDQNLEVPGALTIDRDSNFYFTQSIADRVRKVTPDGKISNLLNFANGGAMTLDETGKLLVANSTRNVYSIDPKAASPVSTMVYSATSYTGSIQSMCAYRGKILITDSNRNSVFQATPGLQAKPDVLVGPNSLSEPWVPANFEPWGIALNDTGHLFVAYEKGDRILRLDGSGAATIFNSTVGGVRQIGFDLQNRLYAIAGSRTVHRIATNGTATQLFQFSLTPLQVAVSLSGIAVAADGTVYLTDSDAQNISLYRIGPDGKCQTIAGAKSWVQPNCPRESAVLPPLAAPRAIALDPKGRVVIADGYQIKRRKDDGTFEVLAGTGRQGTTGDGGPAIQARLNTVTSLAVDVLGNIAFAEGLSGYVRLITTDGLINTIAGTGDNGMSGDGEDPLNASLNFPIALAFGPDSRLYISDHDNKRVRVIQLSTTIVSPKSLTFVASLGGPVTGQNLVIEGLPSAPASQTLDVSIFTVGAVPVWLSTALTRVSVDPKGRSLLPVQADPRGLSPGAYRGQVVLENKSTGERFPIAVTLLVSSSAQSMQLAPDSLAFRVPTGSGDSPAQTVRVANAGNGAFDWKAAAKTLSGGEWLSIGAAAGSSRSGQPAPPVDVRVNPGSLAPGVYYGEIQFSAAGVANAPQSAFIRMEVFQADLTIGSFVAPRGLLFVGSPAGDDPAPQAIRISNPSTHPLVVHAGVSLASGAWATASDGDVTLGPGQELDLNIEVKVKSLASGAYRGTVRLTFDDGQPEVPVDLLLVLADGVKTSGKNALPTAGEQCQPTTLNLVFTAPGGGISTNASWGRYVELRAADDCGQPLNAGTVNAYFTDGYPALGLNWLHDDTWGGNRPSTNSTTLGVEALATSAGPAPVRGQEYIESSTVASRTEPVLLPRGVRNAANGDSDSPFALGSLIRLSGIRLAEPGDETGEPEPGKALPMAAGRTRFILGGELAPIVKLSSTEAVIQLPPGLEPNVERQLVVERGDSRSATYRMAITSVQPAVFTWDGSDRGLGLIANRAGVLSDADNPAAQGQHLVAQLTGLGLTDPPTPPGQVPPAGARIPVSLRLTVGGFDANVVEVRPGKQPGRYDVEFIVPETGLEGNVSVIVEAANRFSRPVTLQMVTK